jgi:hypothetical protein
VHRGSTDGFAVPNGQGWEIAGHSPGPALSARIEPGQLLESLTRNLREALERLPLAGLKQYDFDSAAGQFVR